MQVTQCILYIGNVSYFYYWDVRSFREVCFMCFVGKLDFRSYFILYIMINVFRTIYKSKWSFASCCECYLSRFWDESNINLNFTHRFHGRSIVYRCEITCVISSKNNIYTNKLEHSQYRKIVGIFPNGFVMKSYKIRNEDLLFA